MTNTGPRLQALPVVIVATGSTGNMNIVCDRIVIDCGVKRRVFEPVLDRLELLTVSHRHGDHLNIANIRLIARRRPALLTRVFVNKDTHAAIAERAPAIARQITHIIDGHTDVTLQLSDGPYRLQTFPLAHDVENQGYVITTPSGYSILHATDTATLAYAPDGQFDALLVEGNWDEDTLMDSLTSTDPTAAFRASRNLRHLSVQAMVEFVKTHSHKHSRVYQLHASAAFGCDAASITPALLRAQLQ